MTKSSDRWDNSDISICFKRRVQAESCVLKVKEKEGT